MLNRPPTPTSRRAAIAALTAATSLATPTLALAATSVEIFRDDFAGPSLDTAKWSLATWTQGRTRWGNTPTFASGYASLRLNTYNPNDPTRSTFFGTQLVSKGSQTPTYSRGFGLEFEARVRTNTTTPGLVSTFFTYGAHGDGLSDEIDFEVVTKDNSPAPAAGDYVYLINWNDWSSGENPNDPVHKSTGHPLVPGFRATNWNTFTIRWLVDRTEWLINGQRVRTSFDAVPDDPMSLELSMWAPDSTWTSAYSAALQPATTAAQNVTYTYDVDYVSVRSLPNQWRGATTGTWSATNSWTGPVPTGRSAAAVFGSEPAAPTTVTLDAPQTVASLTFDHTKSYTLTGAALTISSATNPANVTVLTGSHTITAPVTLANSSTVFDIASGSKLTLASTLSAVGNSLVKTSPGVLRLPAFTARSLTVSAGTLEVAPASGTLRLGTLVVASGATLDLADNAAILDYSTTSPLATIRQLLATAATPDLTWTGAGLTSSAARGFATHEVPGPATAIAYAEAALYKSLHNTTTFNDIPVDSTALLLTYTLAGDANLDGLITDADIDRLAAAYNNTLTTNLWTDGDFTYDGVVNDRDLDLLTAAHAFSATSLTPAALARLTALRATAAPIPEPATTALAAPAVACLSRALSRGLIAGARRNRRRAACLCHPENTDFSPRFRIASPTPTPTIPHVVTLAPTDHPPAGSQPRPEQLVPPAPDASASSAELFNPQPIH